MMEKNVVLMCYVLYFISPVLGNILPTLVYEWETIDLVWPNSSVKDEYIQQHKFIPQNNAINGIKLYNNTVYLTIPKLKDGIPFSLVSVQSDGSSSPLVKPFPNWDSHLDGDCTKFKLVQSMEIDPQTGYMWIIDTIFVPRGGTNIADQCPSKIVIWDLNSDTEIHRYAFPKNVTGPGMFYLNDIVLDFDNNTARWAYISDTLGHKLVVYDRKLDYSYSFSHASMKPDPNHAAITIGDVTNMYNPLGINGIALSSDLRYVYYCSVAGISLYRIPTSVLRNNGSTDEEFQKHFVLVGNKVSQSDGLYYGKKHNLYYSTLGPRSVYKWPMITTSAGVSAGTQTEIAKDNRIEWVDSFAFDNDGYLWFVSNNLNTIFTNGSVEGFSNFFVWKVFVDDSSYLYYNQTVGPTGISNARNNWMHSPIFVVVGFVCYLLSY